jgi:hypothetical protein
MIVTCGNIDYAGEQSFESNKYLKILLRTKALRGNPSQTPPARLDCEGLRQCDRLQQYFIYK